MATVTGMTADRMLAIEAASVVDGDVDGSGNLILTKHDGSQINAGSVIGPTGPQGPVGSDLVVLNAISVSDVGIINQIRAGRQLTAADFTNMGLSAPAGLWNLSDLSDVSGNGRNLLNKGAVPFAAGINGVATTAAQFVGSTAQILYISDTGVNDSFRIKTGSFGCWFRTAKRGTPASLVSKWAPGPAQGWLLYITNNNILAIAISTTGSDTPQAYSVSDICDDRWHFAVATYDGSSMRIYADGILEGTFSVSGTIYPCAGTFNIGGQQSDSSSAAINPHFGRIDEAFVSADVLSDDQIRNLYCAKIPHTLAAIPSRVSLNVRRRRKGAALVAADFSTQPLRLYNFSGGSLGDEGSNGQVLINGAAALSVAGVDGSNNNAFNFNGAQALVGTDAGLPSGVSIKSYGFWVKTTSAATLNVFAWGINAGAEVRVLLTQGLLSSISAGDSMGSPFMADGQWHHMVVTEDPAPLDGIKRKMFLDGRLVGISTTLNSVTLGGSTAFRIGAGQTGTAPFIGQIDSAFVCDYALTAERIWQLYAKGSQTLASSPKNSGDHVEGMDAANLLAIFDMLESQHQVDLRVAA